MDAPPREGEAHRAHGVGGVGDAGGKSKETGEGGGQGEGTSLHGGGGLSKRPEEDLESQAVSNHLASSPSPVPGQHYNRMRVKEYMGQSKWTVLEQYLISGVFGWDGDATLKCAPVILWIRRAELRDIVASQDLEKAHSYYKDNVLPLLKLSSEYINGLEMKRDIDEILYQINHGEVISSDHLDRDIDDFFRLYHPIFSGPPDRPEKARSGLWQFATRTYLENSEGGRKPRPTFRCLACGRDFDVAISILKDHFLSGPQCSVCPKVTANILKKIELIYAEAPTLENAIGQKVEAEGHQDDLSSELVIKIEEAQALVKNVVEKRIMNENDRREANEKLHRAYTILGQCVAMAKTGGISVTNVADEALPILDSGGADPPSLAVQQPLEKDTKVFENISGDALNMFPEHTSFQQQLQMGYYLEDQSGYTGGSSASHYPGYQLPPNVLQEQVSSSYMYAHHEFSHASLDPQHQDGWSFQNRTQEAGQSQFPDPGALDSLILQNQGGWGFQSIKEAGPSQFPYPVAQDSQNFQISPNLVGTQPHHSDDYCQHGFANMWDCDVCFGGLLED